MSGWSGNPTMPSDTGFSAFFSASLGLLLASTWLLHLQHHPHFPRRKAEGQGEGAGAFQKASPRPLLASQRSHPFTWPPLSAGSKGGVVGRDRAGP